VLQLQAAQLAVQAEVIKAQNARLQNRIQLHLALGGGWDNHPAVDVAANPGEPPAAARPPPAQ